MTNDEKLKVLIFLLLAVIAAVVIAAVLSQLELKPGVPLPTAKDTEGTLPAEAAPVVAISDPIYFLVILGAAVAAVLVVVIREFRLPKRVPWKAIPWAALAIALLVLVALGFLFGQINISIPQEPEISLPTLKPGGPPLGSVPTSLMWVVWIGLVGLICFLGVQAIRRSTKQRHANDPIKLEAERAVQALKMGLDFKNVIVGCYQQMSLTLQKEEGIELKETMTAREFERLLTARGVPYAPVYQLTRLFEEARYSLRLSTPADEQLAIDCLNAIVRYSREGRQPD